MAKYFGTVVFRKKEGKTLFLIIRHIYSKGGHWHFPKGQSKPTETDEEAAAREVFEETSQKYDLIPEFKEKINYKIVNSKDSELMEVTFFLGRSYYPEVKISPTEIIDYKWGTYDECLSKLTHSEAKELLKKANDFLLKQAVEQN